MYDFNITHVECLKYALSKGLGLGIVLGGAIVKIPQVRLYPAQAEVQAEFPQIITLVSSGSARGLSLTAYVCRAAV